MQLQDSVYYFKSMFLNGIVWLYPLDENYRGNNLPYWSDRSNASGSNHTKMIVNTLYWYGNTPLEQYNSNGVIYCWVAF